MRFIVLTWKNGDKIRYNVAHIVSYYKNGNSSVITLIGDSPEHYVKETPEEIDSLLITNGILVYA